MLEVEKATAARMIDRMEKKGWVERRPDAADRRVNRLHLTAEAELIQVQLAEISDRTVDDALALLSARERDQFAEWMRRVKRQLQAMIGPERAAAAERIVELVK
jgi:DNA-binding MarR family transcriptional regulator